ncbi:MAG: MFS transporter [Pseudomonadota bacterium]
MTQAAPPHRQTLLDFLRADSRWLATGLLLTFGSCFGQTYFISLTGADIRAAYDLSHGGFGLVYTIATTASALTLLRIGWVADRYTVRTLSVVTALALGVACLLMAVANHIVVLVVAIFGLRLAGQGMMTHIAMTAMGRWFSARRGRAVAIASFGFPIGEAIWPLVVVLLMAAIGWRMTWVAAGVAMIFVAAPLYWWIAKVERVPLGGASADAGAPDAAVRPQWPARDAQRDWLMWVLMPGVMAPAFIATSIYFHQAYIAEQKGWTLTTIAASYPVFAIASVAASAACGWLIDAFSARRVLQGALMPLMVGLIILGSGDTPLTAPIAFAFFGIGAGFGTTLAGTLWAELYGTRHLGAIRALIVAVMVFSSAIGPSITGGFIDLGVSVSALMFAMAIYCLGVSGVYLLCQTAMRDRSEGIVGPPSRAPTPPVEPTRT